MLRYSSSTGKLKAGPRMCLPAAALALGAGSSAGGGALPLPRENFSAVSSLIGDAATKAAVHGLQVAGDGGAGKHALDTG